ncbi:MAG: hypothetical protein ACTHJ3_00290 [Pararhizobium sp.]
MAKNTVNDIETDLADTLQGELAGNLMDKIERASRTATIPPADNPFELSARLPRRISGGFRGVRDDLDPRAPEWRKPVRLIEQQRPLLEAAEAERDRLCEAFNRLVPEVQESAGTFKTMLEATKSGDVSGNLAAQFNRNLKVLDELESLAEALTTNMLGIRSTWEQYAKSMIRAQKMREDLKEVVQGEA